MTHARQVVFRIASTVVIASMFFALLVLVFPSQASALSITPEPSIPGNCARIAVILHGFQTPTTLCLQTRGSTSSKADIASQAALVKASTPCNQYLTLEITGELNGYPQDVDFYCVGYDTIHITHMTFLESPSGYGNGWLRIYPSGTNNGSYWSYTGGNTVYYGNYPMTGNYDTTQVCVGCGNY